MQIWDMEEGEGAFSHEKEAKGQNISVGNAKTNSNGNISREDQATLLETVRRLKVEMHSYKEDNEKMVREQNQINVQVMKILNRLHRQEKNGSSSRQEEDGKHHERRDNYRRVGHSRSIGRTHEHHSHPYSTKKIYASKYSISSPEVSPFRHQRRRHELDRFARRDEEA
jgi:hypothetical protein